MNQIEEIALGGTIAIKLNEAIRVLNSLILTEKEVPIYEILHGNDTLIISKDKDGVLVARNHSGEIQLERITYPKEADQNDQ